MVTSSLLFDTEYYAPTQTSLQKWLREKHNILVESTHYTAKHFTYKIYRRRESIEIVILGGVRNIYPTYEEALEAGLIAALILI
jgi:hypothetical protein